MIKHEENEQIAVMRWAQLMEPQLPELSLLHHIPNGGKRNALEARYLKLAGVKAGIPDLCLPVPRGGYHGLYIELKYGKNKPTAEQERMIGLLTENGHLCKVCYGADEAIQTITDYLKGDKNGFREIQK